MKLQILVSSLNQEVKSLAEKMNLQADTILKIGRASCRERV